MALDAQDWASHGGQMPKVMKDFIRRTTDPNLGGLTYSEARQFLSNAGERLSTAEQMKLTPKATRSISQFASSWNSAIRYVAEDAGVLDHYTDVVDQYRQAMKLNNFWKATRELGKQQAVQILKWSVPA